MGLNSFTFQLFLSRFSFFTEETSDVWTWQFSLCQKLDFTSFHFLFLSYKLPVWLDGCFPWLTVMDWVVMSGQAEWSVNRGGRGWVCKQMAWQCRTNKQTGEQGGKHTISAQLALKLESAQSSADGGNMVHARTREKERERGTGRAVSRPFYVHGYSMNLSSCHCVYNYRLELWIGNESPVHSMSDVMIKLCRVEPQVGGKSTHTHTRHWFLACPLFSICTVLIVLEEELELPKGTSD